MRWIAPINPYAPIDFAVELEALDSEPTSSSGSTRTSETSVHLGAAGFSDIFGSSDSDSDSSGDSLFSSTTSESGSDLSSAGESEDEGEDIPDLLPITDDSEDLDSEDDTSDSEDEETDDNISTSSSDDGNLADIEDWDDFEVPRMSTTVKLARGVRDEYEAMYAS